MAGCLIASKRGDGGSYGAVQLADHHFGFGRCEGGATGNEAFAGSHNDSVAHPFGSCS